MRIGVYRPAQKFVSVGLHVYRNNITRALKPHGVSFVYFDTYDALPTQVDLLWDPRAASASKPHPLRNRTGKPQLITLHDVLSFSTPADERLDGHVARAKDHVRNLVKWYNWRYVRRDETAAIAISQFVKDESIRHLHLSPDQIVVVQCRLVSKWV